jgi:cyclase
MNVLRWRFAKIVATLGLMTAWCAQGFAQDFENAVVKTEMIAPNLYVLFGVGGNIGVSVGEDAVFVIDDQYGPMAPKIAAAIKQITDKPVKFVINTHWHGDHTGGNEAMGKAGAIIVAHDNVRKRMSSEQFISLLAWKVPPSPAIALPAVTFSSDATFHLNGDEIYVFHAARAHTDGDAIVQFRKANVIHMGDNFFNGLYPFIDTSSGGHPDGVIAVANRVMELADANTKIIPGHGPVTNKAELKVLRDMLVTVTMRVKAMLKKGKTLKEIVAAKPSAEFDERWGKGFIPPERFITMLVAAYEKPKGN